MKKGEGFGSTEPKGGVQPPVSDRLSRAKAKKRLFLSALGVLCIVLLALGIRSYSVIKNPETSRYGLGIFGDTFAYHDIAYNLARGNGFRITDEDISQQKFQKEEKGAGHHAFHRGPVYPFFMSLVYRFFGLPKESLSLETWHVNWDRVRLSQCALDALTCVLVFFLARALCGTLLGPAFLACFLYCFSFYNIYYTRELLSETVAAFLVTAFMLAAITALKGGKAWQWLVAGILFGLIPLCRPEYLMFVFFFAAFLAFFYRSKWKAAFKGIFLFGLAAGLVILPWTARNYALFKRPVVISTGGLGEGLYMGTLKIDPAREWEWLAMPYDPTVTEEEREATVVLHAKYPSTLLRGSIDEVQALDGEYIKLAVERIRRYPFYVASNWIAKIPRLWYQNYINKYNKSEASGWFFIFYFVFAVYALLAERPPGRSLMWPIALLFVYLTLVFMPFEVEPRYGVAIMPSLICLTGLGVYKLLRRFGQWLIR